MQALQELFRPGRNEDGTYLSPDEHPTNAACRRLSCWEDDKLEAMLREIHRLQRLVIEELTCREVEE